MRDLLGYNYIWPPHNPQLKCCNCGALKEQLIPHRRRSNKVLMLKPRQKLNQMIVKQVGGYSCKHCEYISSKSHKIKDHMTEHVEKHIEGLKYSCSSCAIVFRLSHSFRRHEKQCVKKFKIFGNFSLFWTSVSYRFNKKHVTI